MMDKWTFGLTCVSLAILYSALHATGSNIYAFAVGTALIGALRMWQGRKR